MFIDDYLLINCHLIIWMQYILIKIIKKLLNKTKNMCRSIIITISKTRMENKNNYHVYNYDDGGQLITSQNILKYYCWNIN